MTYKLIYLGRLDKEKGIEHLIYVTTALINQGIRFHFDIYGKGSYTDQITQLANNYPNNITYHGRQHKKQIFGQIPQCDFVIMPSVFLETFGLTACEALLAGTPIIAPRQGGLIPFIDPLLDIHSYPGNNIGEKLFACIIHLIDHKIQKSQFLPFIQSIQTHYTPDHRYSQISTVLSPEVLMVSDFVNYDGGGVEIHIHDSAHLLKIHGHNVEIYGHYAPKKRAALIKLIGMAGSICNLIDAYRVRRHLQPQTQVRLHSISRIIGRCTIAYLPGNNHIMTHHELGLFHPFPSQVTDVANIPSARSLGAFVQASKKTDFLTRIAVSGKYLLNILIHKQLKKKVKTHIVPSARMIPVVQARHPDSTVICIPHFVQGY